MSGRSRERRKHFNQLITTKYMPHTYIVVTTIRVPVFLRDILENASAHGHQKDTFSILVIGDVKTPPEAKELCIQLASEFGRVIEYFTIADQERELAEYPGLLELIPKNSGLRKKIGTFIAYQRGGENIIMVDDDNFPRPETDFIGFHNIVGTEVEIDCISSPTGWFNTYETLEEKRGLKTFPRGYPWLQRTVNPPPHERKKQRVKVAINQGAVFADTDVDTIARLFSPIDIVAMKDEYKPGFGLTPGTWISFNEQNTALAREWVPIFYTPIAARRNSDIWTAFMMCHIAQHMGEVVTFGYPLVNQFRNPHDLFEDLGEEIGTYRATDRFVELVRSVPLTEKTHLGVLDELLHKCLSALPALTGVTEVERGIIKDFFVEYQAWSKIMPRK